MGDPVPSVQKDEPMDVWSGEEPLPTNSEETDVELPGLSTDCGKGFPISELRQGYDCWGPPPRPYVHPSANHTVLYKLPWRPGEIPRPYPKVPSDRWDQDHVRMPHSSESLYPVQEADDERGLRLRWELVQEALLRTILSSHQLESAILSYNSRYNDKWNFRALHTLLNEVLEKEELDIFFKSVLPGMTSLALQLPELITGSIPLLRKHKCHTVSLSQLQIGSLLANAFFCTFPRRNSTKRGSEYSSYPDINFNRLFQASDSGSVIEKLKCILNYFRRICLSGTPQGSVTFSRRYIPSGSFPNWSRSTRPLPKMHITSSGFIEDEGSGMLQVDFANKFVGGGVLGWGCVQEEIRFVICPELIVSRLFTECLDATEALIIVGCERFSAYSGYSSEFEWVSDFIDKTPLDSTGRRHCSIVAMDALHFSDPSTQYNLQNLAREVNKAYVGFCETGDQDGNALAPIATGNWGCGAFRGDAHLKVLLQLLAAGEARRGLAYFTFGDESLRDRIYGMYKFLMDNCVTVGQLWNLLCQYGRKFSSSSCGNVPDLYDFLYSSVLEGFESKVSDIKPTVAMKRKDPSVKPKQIAARPKSEATSRDLADAGLTAEDLDFMIEEFDSDEDQIDETIELESKKKSNPSPPLPSSSCLNLIEESLHRGNIGSKPDVLPSSSSKPKSTSSTVSKGHMDTNTQSDENCSINKEVVPQSITLLDEKPSCGKDSKGFSTPTEKTATVNVSSQSSSSKRSTAPKRKISDYFSPS